MSSRAHGPSGGMSGQADPASRLAAAAEQLGLQLDAGQQEKLLTYLQLIAKWNKVYNLTAVRPYVPAKPTTISVDLGTVDSGKEFMGRRGVEFVNPLKIVSRGKDWMQAWDQIWKW